MFSCKKYVAYRERNVFLPNWFYNQCPRKQGIFVELNWDGLVPWMLLVVKQQIIGFLLLIYVKTLAISFVLLCLYFTIDRTVFYINIKQCVTVSKLSIVQ